MIPVPESVKALREQSSVIRFADDDTVMGDANYRVDGWAVFDGDALRENVYIAPRLAVGILRWIFRVYR